MSIVNKSLEIINGWGNYIFPSSEVEELAKKRAEICGPCENNVDGKCAICHCPLVAKTRSTISNCPIQLW